MRIMNKKQVLQNEKFVVNEILTGKIFIYPTDTIYGIGCDATNNESVKRIREIKQRESKPFSVIAPNKQWIKDNCVISQIAEQWIKKLPGPCTLILKLKNKSAVSEAVTPTDTIGVRIPDNWFSEIIKKTGIPFITTSVNISGEPHIAKIEELEDKIKNQVDYIIEDGVLNNPPSTIIDLTSKEEIVINRQPFNKFNTKD